MATKANKTVKDIIDDKNEVDRKRIGVSSLFE